MKKLVYLSMSLFLLLSCGAKDGKLVDLSQPKGDTIKLYNPVENDSLYWVVGDTIHVNDTIVNILTPVECEEYTSLRDLIHRGENCRGNNVSAVAIAKAQGNTARVKALNKQTEEAEAKGREAEAKLQEHLQTCNVCKLLGNE